MPIRARAAWSCSPSSACSSACSLSVAAASARASSPMPSTISSPVWSSLCSVQDTFSDSMHPIPLLALKKLLSIFPPSCRFFLDMCVLRFYTFINCKKYLQVDATSSKGRIGKWQPRKQRRSPRRRPQKRQQKRSSGTSNQRQHIRGAHPAFP